MNAVLVACTCLLVALPSVIGHAELVTPVAFNPNPSKTFRCGGVNSGPISYLNPNTANGLSWKLIASDGVGAISLLVDPSGSTTNFPTANGGTSTGNVVQVPLTALDGDPTVVGQTYDFTFNIPSGLTCSGTGSSCVGQVSSVSNWVACFAFTLTAPAPISSTAGTTTDLPGTCVTPGVGSVAPLTTCTMVNGQAIWVLDGSSVADMDAIVLDSLNRNVPNAAVFANQPQAVGDTTSPCYESYFHYLCGSTFIRCNTQKTAKLAINLGGNYCNSNCKSFICWCGLTQEHAFLYTCSSNNAGVDGSGKCELPWGPNNTTCTLMPATSSGPNCISSPDLCAAPHNAVVQPLVLAAAALAAIGLRYVL